MSPRTIALLLAAAVGACAPAAGTGRAVPDRDVVGADELAATRAPDLLTALRQVRPEFLQPRGVSSIHNATPDYPAIYLDGVQIGGVDQLGNISTVNVREVRRLSAAQALTRTGTATPGGAILIFTKKGG